MHACIHERACVHIAHIDIYVYMYICTEFVKIVDYLLSPYIQVCIICIGPIHKNDMISLSV